MPTFRPGHLSAVAVGTIDATQFLNNTDWKHKIETADVSHYGASAKEYIPGLAEGSLSLSGMFDANRTANAVTLDGVADALLNVTGDTPITMAFDGGLVVGRRCAITSAKAVSYKPSAPIGGAVSVDIDAICNGRPLDGYVLTNATPLGDPTTITTTYAAVDNAVATTNGGTAVVHVVASTRNGSTTVKVQHSVDNTTWVDLLTAPVVTPGNQGAFILTATGTVNRYIRATATVNAGSGLVTVIAAFARN